LDEPTSALDQGSEQQVVKNLSAKLQHKTAIIVTHRNAILSICDRVLVFENGQIIADGPPENFGVKKPNAKA
jgi:ABC-type bacteriocin/lantibiotic exporter with double-glycine peptidase domain